MWLGLTDCLSKQTGWYASGQGVLPGVCRHPGYLCSWLPAPQSPEGLLPVCIQSLFILCSSLRAVMETSWFLSPNSSSWVKRGMYRHGSGGNKTEGKYELKMFRFKSCLNVLYAVFVHLFLSPYDQIITYFDPTSFNIFRLNSSDLVVETLLATSSCLL